MPLFRKAHPQTTLQPTSNALGSPAHQPLFNRSRGDSVPLNANTRGAIGGGGGIPVGGGGNRFNPRPAFTNIILLIGFVVGFVGWWTAFISMCVAESKLGAFVDGPYCGTLWFAIIFQAAILIHLFLATAYDNLPLHRLQLCFILAVVTTFAINGVQYIYAGENITRAASAVKGVGAGWLLLALVDVLLLLYLSSEEDTFLYGIFNFLGNGGLTPPSRHWATSNAYGGTSSRGLHGVGAGRDVSFPNTAGGTDEYSLGGGNGLQHHHHGLVNLNGSDQHGVGNDEMSRNLPANGVPMGYGGQASGPKIGGLGGRVEPLAGGDLGAPIMGATGAAGGIPRAKALYAYTASPDDPNEVSFAKGEVLDIIESTGKWWQCRTASGQTGIAPSNYLQLL